MHKGYRCLHPSGRLYIARTVLFNESEFPYTTLFDESPPPSAIPQAVSSQIPALPTLLPQVFPTNSSSHSSTSAPNSPLPSVSADSSTSPAPSSNNTNNSRSVSQSSSSSHIPTSSNIHPMATRSKCGVFKPKVYIAISNLSPTAIISSTTSGSSDSHIKTSRFTEPLSDDEALKHPLWHKAMAAEIEAIRLKDTWEVIPPSPFMNPIDCKWVYRVKLNADDTLDKLKARLVAKGFQQLAGLDFLETFSPVVKPVSVRLLFSLAATFQWDIQHIDINNAFLNGYLDTPVYMKQPPGFEDPKHPEWVCKLKKSLYGLKQAPRA